MASIDLIRTCYSAPMDWGQFENLVCDILSRDDLPSIRKLGGVADKGMDAVEESFFENTINTDTIVQITSQKAQLHKLRTTISKLKKYGKIFRKLIIVYRDPVPSDIRINIQAEGMEENILIDPRDEDYIIRFLADSKNGLFVRYFLPDIKSQVNLLLDERDPLDYANDRIRRAMLASLGTYVINPEARNVKENLFDRIVLAALLAHGGKISVSELIDNIIPLMPGETINRERVISSIEKLKREGFSSTSGDTVWASEKGIETTGVILLKTKLAFENLFVHLIKQISNNFKLNDATRGRLERNLRRSILLLVRAIGPTDNLGNEAINEIQVSQNSFLSILGNGIDRNIARTAVIAFSSFVRDPANQDILATLARAYAAICVRNVDPLGKKWQQMILARPKMFLDTDVVLALLIEEIPDHRITLDALKSLNGNGVNLIIPKIVLEETTTHITRADRTYHRFQGSLKRLPEEVVLNNVWNAVVIGYYYYKINGGSTDFEVFWKKYYDKEQPFEYVRFIMSRRIDYNIHDDFKISDEDSVTLEGLMGALVETRERKRLKARFREEDNMTDRARKDIAMALYISNLPLNLYSIPEGYIVSSDTVFLSMQRNTLWGKRPAIYLNSKQIAKLAEYTCGIKLHDDDLVKLLFNPVLIAAAEDISEDLVALAKTGVDLRCVDLNRLEWNMKNSFHGQLLDYKDATNSFDRIQRGIFLAEVASDAGYDIDPDMKEILSELKEAKSKAAIETEKRTNAESVIRKIATEATSIKKTKRRIMKIINEMGGLPPEEPNT